MPDTMQHHVQQCMVIGDQRGKHPDNGRALEATVDGAARAGGRGPGRALQATGWRRPCRWSAPWQSTPGHWMAPAVPVVGALAEHSRPLDGAARAGGRRPGRALQATGWRRPGPWHQVVVRRWLRANPGSLDVAPPGALAPGVWHADSNKLHVSYQLVSKP